MDFLASLNSPVSQFYPLDIRHDDEDDNIVLEVDAISLYLVHLHFELLDNIDELAAVVKTRCDKCFEFVAGIRGGVVFCGVKNCMELNLINRLGFGAAGRLEDGISDGASYFLADGVNDTFLGIDSHRSCYILTVCLFAGVGPLVDIGNDVAIFACFYFLGYGCRFLCIDDLLPLDGAIGS